MKQEPLQSGEAARDVVAAETLPYENQPPRKRHLFFYLIVILLSILYLWIGSKIFWDKAAVVRSEKPMESIPARVVEILDDHDDIGTIGGSVYYERVITFDAKILSGPERGSIVRAMQTIDNMTSHGTIPIQEGDKIFLMGIDPTETIHWAAGDYYRFDYIMILGAAFLFGLILFGRSKGFKTILSLIFTCLAIFMVFIPSILAGYNVYTMSIVTCLYVIVVTLLLVSGPSRKSLSAALGCAGGVMVAGLLTVLMDRLMHLTGYLNEESVYISLLNENDPIDLKGIIFAAIIIGAVGATMDVAMDITSSLFEIHKKAPHLPFHTLIRSGFTIGQDIMGTMANTLILAYIGSSLPTVLLFASYQTSLDTLLNRELLIVEMLQALCGSIGILCTIPISALIASLLCYIDWR